MGWLIVLGLFVLIGYLATLFANRNNKYKCKGDE